MRIPASIAFLTDSASDLTDEQIEKHGIRVLNMYLAIEDKPYEERVDFTSEAFCEMLRTLAEPPVTSHITTFRFAEAFEAIAAEGTDDLICVTLNSTGSATYDAACMAARQFAQEHPNGMRIHMVDSRTYSMALGGPILEAAEMAKQGRNVEEILTWLRYTYDNTAVAMTAFSLKFIRQSGRISAAAALVGDLLGLRPVITLVKGVSAVCAKVRGDKAAMQTLACHVREDYNPARPYDVGYTNPAHAEPFIEICTRTLGVPPRRSFQVGCCVAINTGPETIAVVYQKGKGSIS